MSTLLPHLRRRPLPTTGTMATAGTVEAAAVDLTDNVVTGSVQRSQAGRDKIATASDENLAILLEWVKAEIARRKRLTKG